MFLASTDQKLKVVKVYVQKMQSMIDTCKKEEKLLSEQKHVYNDPTPIRELYSQIQTESDNGYATTGGWGRQDSSALLGGFFGSGQGSGMGGYQNQPFAFGSSAPSGSAGYGGGGGFSFAPSSGEGRGGPGAVRGMIQPSEPPASGSKGGEGGAPPSQVAKPESPSQQLAEKPAQGKHLTLSPASPYRGCQLLLFCSLLTFIF